ncbi:selenoprotein M [Amblyraja radiata]|uniref:selenoprotein M n=1 Tax=Amblyraja radiata TaxID=386614 RepID=UPI0014028FB0|nr:selenoprotein M [Amblyraja radiata]
MFTLVLLLGGLLQATAAYRLDFEKPQGLARGRVEVKAFVQEDLPLYHNLVLKYVPGAKPELLLLNYNLEELDRVNLMPLTRKEINELLLKLGFYKKQSPDAPVPPEFYYAPLSGKPTAHTAAKPLPEDVTEKQEDSDDSDELKEDL